MMERTNLAKKQIDLIKESICVETKCLECRDLFKKGVLCFAVIDDFIDDRGRSCLFRLKRMSHELFRNSDKADYKEKLYDITVGYIFHEAMKLRENLYQIEYYKPQGDAALRDLTTQEKKTVHEIELLIKKAEKRLKGGLKEVTGLSKQLVGQLKDLIKSYKDNYLLPRFILENEKSLVKIYGKRGLEGLLNEMYGDGKLTLVYKAAESYLQSEHYERARMLFQKIHHHDDANKRSYFLYLYSSAFYLYYKNRYTRSHAFAKEAYSMGIEGEGVHCYKELLNRLIEDVSKELRRTKTSMVRGGK